MRRLRFPESRAYPKTRTGGRRLLAAILLIAMIAVAWRYDPRETVSADGAPVHVADGDSFSIGTSKLRLVGIDAPEYGQRCLDAQNREWRCGEAARAALARRLLDPGLTCKAQTRDRYARALATCSTARTTDIAAAQVSDGMAVSHEYYGIRDYPDEEDAARAAKRGLWQGRFDPPAEWRNGNRQINSGP